MTAPLTSASPDAPTRESLGSSTGYLSPVVWEGRACWHCGDCPYLKVVSHPEWSSEGVCWFYGKKLDYYDGFIAMCVPGQEGAEEDNTTMSCTAPKEKL